MLGEAELYAGAQPAWLWTNFVGLIGFGAFVALAVFRRTDDPPSGKAKRLFSATRSPVVLLQETPCQSPPEEMDTADQSQCGWVQGPRW